MQTLRIFEGAGTELDCHSHEFLEFQAVLRGSVRWDCRGKTAVLGPGDVFFAPCRTGHTIRDTGADTRILTVQLAPDWVLASEKAFSGILLGFPGAFDCFLPGDGALFSLLLRLDAVHREGGYGWELAARGLAMELLGAVLSRHCDRGKLSPPPAGRDNGVKYAQWIQEYLDRHYTSAINLDQIAGHLGLTKGYVCRVFKQHTGTTIIHYVNLLRCRQAIELVEGGCSITQAAGRVGFNDYNYFSRVFKKTIGKRPSDFVEK